MVEPEAVVALVERAVGSEQLLPREGEQRAAQPIGLVRGQKLGDGAAVEQPTFDRSALQHRALPRLEAIDPGREERLDRRRHRLVRSLRIVGEHGEHLLDEQRIALGGVDDPVAKRGSDVPAVQQPVDQMLRLVVAERRERDEPRARPWRSPGRPGVEEVRTREAEEQDRRATREAEDVLEQVEQRGLRPVDVVHRDDERSRDGERLEEPAERPGGLLGRARLVARADRAKDQPLCDVPAVDVRQKRTEGRRGIGPRDVAHDVGEREVGDAVAVRDAPSDDDARVLLERAQGLSREAGLADPRWPDDGGERARRLAHRGVEGIAQLAELAAAADEERRDRPGEGRHVRTQAEQPPGNERPALALRLDLAGAGSAAIASRTRSYVASPRSTSPGSAACSSRAATFTASPVASFWSATA